MIPNLIAITIIACVALWQGFRLAEENATQDGADHPIHNGRPQYW